MLSRGQDERREESAGRWLAPHLATAAVSIADLMAVVGLASLGMRAGRACGSLRAQAGGAVGLRHRRGADPGVAALPVADLEPAGGRPALVALGLLGIAAVFLAMVTAVCVGILSVALAEGAALLIFMLLSLVVYLTTWD